MKISKKERITGQLLGAISAKSSSDRQPNGTGAGNYTLRGCENMKEKEEDMNIKIRLAYDGTNYSGWQKTNTAAKPSVQETVEEQLSGLLLQKIRIFGSGRTDAGVHALGQTANFKYKRKNGCAAEPFLNSPADLSRFRNGLNARLPEDIRILSAERVHSSFHSRYDAVSKTYGYRIDLRNPPCVFERRYCHREERLCVDDMKRAVELLTGTHDFAAFSTGRNDGKPTVRTLFEVSMENKGSLLCINFTGNGFLYHMVRILAGTLIEIGRGQRTPSEIEEMLRSKKRSDAGWMAPAQGLFLKEVTYEHV